VLSLCEDQHVISVALYWQVFDQWNRAELESFLIEITRDILKFHDVDGTSLVDKILDTAGQV